MEQNGDSLKKFNKSLLGKKTKSIKIDLISEDVPNTEESNKDSFLIETSAELSNDNLINLDEKPLNGPDIPGFDDINIPSFFNDITKNNDINRKIKKYYKIKKELGSIELVKLYRIDINKLYGVKKKI